MRKNISLAALFSAAIITSATAQPTFNKAKMDSFFNAIELNNKGMGSIAIAKNGKVLYSKSTGYAYSGNDRKIHADYATKYRIGSITKMFTTTMVFQLVEEGKLTLNTPLDKYFPKVPNAKKITIGNLLNHHSGIHNFTDDSTYTTWNQNAHTQAQMLDIIIKGGSDFAPGSKGEYSNSNFILLGYIVEKITGQTYKDALAKRITSKLGLANTYCGSKTNKDNNEAYSYTIMPGDAPNVSLMQETETDMSVPGGAGSIVSTPIELTVFINALFTGKLVKPSSLEQMKTIKDNYGMGLFQLPFGNKKGYGHTGGIDGFSSSLGYFPDDSLAIAYCNNGNVYGTNEIMIGALSIYYNRPFEIPTFKTYPITAAELEPLKGVYASKQIPLKITITTKGNIMYAQATGQPAFPLEATDKNSFKFDQADVVLLFNAEKHEMTLKQGGGEFTFVKE